jgi:MFS family permease
MAQVTKISIQGTIIWIVCAVFFMYEFLLRTILGTFEHPITYDLNLNLIKFAILSSTAYMVVYGLMQIPVGIITDRIGLKKSLFWACLVCALSVFGFGITHSFNSAFLFRILMGLGSSFGFICLLVAVYDWMPQKNIALFIGLSQFIGTMGPILAAGPMNDLATFSNIDWRFIFYSLGIVGIVIAVIVLLIVRNNSDYTGSFQIIKRPEPFTNSLYALLRQPQTWFIALFSGSIYFTIEYLSENSGKAFLMLHGYSSKTASYMITIAWIGYAIGCPLLGFISDWTGKRKSMMVLASLVSILSVIVIIFFPINVTTLCFAFVLLGVGASGQSIGFAIMAEQCGNSYLAAGLGFNNAVIAMITSLNAPLIGWALTISSAGHTPDIKAYQSAFSIIIIFLLLSLLLASVFIKETFCKSTKTPFKLIYSN